MKKFLAAMFACSLAFSACFAVIGCGGDGATDGDATPKKTADPAGGEEGAEKAGEGESA